MKPFCLFPAPGLGFLSLFLFNLWVFPTTTLAKPKAPEPLLISGAGASFPYILYSKWFAEYTKVEPEVRINYRSIGSGGGIRQFLTGTLYFGATDVPVKKQILKKAKKNFLQLPTTLGAVVISYHIPGIKNQTLKFKASTLKKIYFGEITKWNHPELQALHPQIKLPDHNIVPVYRADGSGTTAVFTEYLSSFSTEWLKKAGKGKSIRWPVGLGGKGNEGVTGLIQKIPGSIGYIAMSYALTRKLPMAQIQNHSHHFVKASLSSVTKAAQTLWQTTPNWLEPLTKAPGPLSYPLAAYTYLLVPQDMTSKKGQYFFQFLNWYLKEGQSFCQPLYYAPLPEAVIHKVRQKLKTIKTSLPHDNTS